MSTTLDRPATAEQQLRVLCNAAALLASSLEFDETLAHTISAYLPALGDFGFFDVIVEDAVHRIVRAHNDPETEAILLPTRWMRQQRTDINLCALSSGQAALHANIDDAWYRDVAVDESHLSLLRQLAFRSMITVPMRYRGELVGALTLFMGRSGRQHHAADLVFAEELALLAALALDNARLYADAERARREAETASRAKDEFLAMLGHELRNPLAPIVTALELMALRGDQSTQYEQGVIGRQVAHLSRLVDDLLDIARITKGKVQLKLERLEIAAVLRKAVELMRPTMEKNKLHFDCDLPLQPVYLNGDMVRLTQVFGNLLSNASKFTPVGGRVHLAATVTDGRIQVTVKDSGSGISSELLPHVFDLFVQGPQHIDRQAGGLGLGLTIAKTLIKMHGGTISVESAGLGQGSTFHVQLPCIAGMPLTVAS